ncbi:MAG: serine hydrolase [Saprospiraceae bacterium]|nr:serine hydrolase [Candidatus Defluviibacterium haderslevense]
MKRHNLNVQFASMMLIIITCFSCSKTDIDRPATLDCTLEKEIIYKTNPKSTIYQSIIDKYVKLGLPGVILLVKNDSGFYVGAAGMADIKEGIKMQPCHISKIASVTKFELGVAMMRLQEKGILSLDDPISKFISKDILNKISNGNEPLTIRNLLNHTSGIYDIIDDPGFYLQVLNHPTKKWNADDLLKFLYHKDAAFKFNPAENSGYSNSNYTLLSMIIEAATHKPHAQIMHEEFIDVLGLKDTYYFWHDPLPSQKVAQGYYNLYNDGNLINLTQWNTGSGNGYGGMYSTVWDMYLFIDALFVKKTLLTQKSLDEMLVFHPLVSTRKLLGVACFKDFIDIGDPLKDYAWGHRGRDLSYSADLYYFPEHHATMSLIVNYGTDGDTPLRPVFKEMRDEIAKIIISQ